MELFITADFCETMYSHYAERLQFFKNDPMRRILVEQLQQSYVDMHELVVSFETLTAGLPIQHIDK